MDESAAIKNFPALSRKDQQLIWLFENYLTRGIKLREVQKKLDSISGKPIKIENVARRLKKEGKLPSFEEVFSNVQKEKGGRKSRS